MQPLVIKTVAQDVAGAINVEPINPLTPYICGKRNLTKTFIKRIEVINACLTAHSSNDMIAKKCCSLDPPYWGNENDYGKGLFSRDDFALLMQTLRKRWPLCHVSEGPPGGAIDHQILRYRGRKLPVRLALEAVRKRERF